MQERIVGTTMPVLELMLEPGEAVISETGEMSWLSETIDISTTTGSGGIAGVFKRVMGGSSAFLTTYSAQSERGMVAFSTKIPGGIIAEQIDPTDQGTWMVHAGGFVCGTPGIQLSMGFQKSFSAGMFGGEGFILQKVGGEGKSWFELGGEIVSYDLAPGQRLRVHPGHIGAFQSTVQFDITMIHGVKNVLFGGEGLFLAQLTGPGRVYLQSLTLSGLAMALSRYMPTAAGSSSYAT